CNAIALLLPTAPANGIPTSRQHNAMPARSAPASLPNALVNSAPTAKRGSKSWKSRKRPNRTLAAGEVVPPEIGREEGEAIFRDRTAHACHQLLVKGQVMLGEQHGAEDLARLVQVVKVGAAVVGADVTGAAFVERRGILRVARIPEIDGPGMGEALPVAARAAGQDAVEHVDPAFHRANQVIRLAHAHQVARAVLRQHGGSEVERSEHRLLPLAHGKSADGIAVEPDIAQGIGAFPPQALIERALLDAEQRRGLGMFAA